MTKSDLWKLGVADIVAATRSGERSATAIVEAANDLCSLLLWRRADDFGARSEGKDARRNDVVERNVQQGERVRKDDYLFSRVFFDKSGRDVQFLVHELLQSASDSSPIKRVA